MGCDHGLIRKRRGDRATEDVKRPSLPDHIGKIAGLLRRNAGMFHLAIKAAPAHAPGDFAADTFRIARRSRQTETRQ
jgi:hypothetical protein